jgi:hypothetical protein
MAAGTMVELTAARNDIDTADQLQIFEMAQKGFVVNGSKLKIVDFVNTKLTHTALTTPHAPGDILTQDQTGGKYAYMSVDYTNAAKTETYGYAYYSGGATAFNTTNSVTGSGTGTSFTPATVVAAPHWRDWTVYQGDTATYGEMPAKAYLGCRYYGRAVLAGNPLEPYQWYMSRIGQPYDWAYAANDAASAIKGGNSEAQQLGDIIRALIPYKDDYLVFGCASSIWYLMGNPTSGGALMELDKSTGIFGASSWCWDNEGNLYLLGNNGIYKGRVPGGLQCITDQSYPRLMKSEGLDPSTHRVSLGYDADRGGILIAITVLATGVNSNYWLDLKVKDDTGRSPIFPEVYPAAASAYSLYYYDSNDPDLRGLLVGGQDGYIRTFSDTAKSDDAGITDVAIDSYAVLGPLPVGDGGRREGTIEGVDLVVAGGAAGGTSTDSNDVTMKIFGHRVAEAVIEQAKANVNPRYACIFKGPGNRRGSTRRQSISAMYAAIRLGNATLNESWAFEDLHVSSKLSGRAK